MAAAAHTVVLIHLGESIPWHLQDCVHQLRLWNPDRQTTRIQILLERCQESNPFWAGLEKTGGVQLQFTDTLQPTEHHRQFLRTFRGDSKFRNGFWKFVRERFFFLEEFLLAAGPGPVLAIEYDVLLYRPIASLVSTLSRYASNSLAAVKDAPGRIHPGVLWIPSPDAISKFTQFVAAQAAVRSELEDMQLLCKFQEEFPEALQFLPVLSPNRPQPVSYLSAGFETLQTLFDSAVVGQFVGGIDPRNTAGAPSVGYQNETALYKFTDFDFTWVRTPAGLWQPTIDGAPLASIHMHSKALFCFLSDRADEPKATYDIRTLLQQLEPN